MGLSTGSSANAAVTGTDARDAVDWDENRADDGDEEVLEERVEDGDDIADDVAPEEEPTAHRWLSESDLGVVPDEPEPQAEDEPQGLAKDQQVQKHCQSESKRKC